MRKKVLAGLVGVFVLGLLALAWPAERAAAPGISTSIPEGTRLLGLTFRKDLATVNLSHEFEAPGDRMSALGRLGQIV